MALNAHDRLDLNVAIFSYTPESAFAIERFEETFEAAHPEIDLDLVLWDPYADEFKKRGLEKIKDFDIVEIDVCRLTELVAGEFGGLDEVPKDCRQASEIYIGPARELAESQLGSYVVPHWACGNFLYSWKSSHPDGIPSFEKLLAATSAEGQNPLLANLWGRSGLGFLYFDCLIDTVGEEAAQKHLTSLFEKEAPTKEDLIPEALETLVKLKSRLPGTVSTHLSHFDDHAYVFPRWFADKPASLMFGFSERLYYTERELQLKPGTEVPVVKKEQLNIEELPLAATSQGMPAWIDAFVVPKGKLQAKPDAIKKFLNYVVSKDGFLPFIEPQEYLAPTYLLPSVKAIYQLPESEQKQPLLPEFMAELERATPVADHRIWQGMRKAGALLQDTLRGQ